MLANLQASNSPQGNQPEERGVESSGHQVDHLVLSGGQSQTIPERQYGEGDATQTSQHEKEVVHLVKWSGDIQFLGVGQKSASMEDCLRHVLKNQQAESQTGVREL